MTDCVEVKAENVETVFIEALDLAGEEASVLGLCEAGNVLKQDEVERVAVAVQAQGEGKEASHEFGAWIVSERGAVRGRETLARRATDYSGGRELGAVVGVHFREPKAGEVGDMGAMVAGPVAVPGGDGISTDVVG